MRFALSYVQIAALLAASQLLSLTDQATADARDLETTDVESLTELSVELNDDDGNPVSGAAVMVYAMRMVEEQGHGYWNHQKLGPPKQVLSDERGIAVVKYPAKVYFSPRTMTTAVVTFNVNHADFVSEIVNFDVGPKTAEVSLKRGCEIQLSAIGENGDPISEFGVLVAGRYAPLMWADAEDGGRRTGAASDGTWQTMLVKPQDDGRTLFSSVLPLRVRPSQAVRIRNVTLKPGTRVLGTLSDDVPRPVKNGYAITVTIPKLAGDSWAEEDPSVTWTHSVSIDEAGNFELKSVPRSGQIQIIALCDGWVSETVPTHNFFVMGQLFPIDSEDELSVTVDMERTGTLELTVTKPDGTPLDGGKVSSWPNQKYHHGGSTILGARFSSMQIIKNQLVPADQQKPTYSRDFAFLPFMEQPVKDGTAILSGLPVGRKHSLLIQHPEFMFADAGESGEAQFSIESSEPKQMSIKTKAIKN